MEADFAFHQPRVFPFCFANGFNDVSCHFAVDFVDFVANRTQSMRVHVAIESQKTERGVRPRAIRNARQNVTSKYRRSSLSLLIYRARYPLAGDI